MRLASVVMVASLLACGDDDGVDTTTASQLDEALEAARAEAGALERAVASPPADTSSCAVPSADAAGPNLWQADAERRSVRLARFEEAAEELRAELGDLSEAGARRWLERIAPPRYELVVLPESYTAPVILLAAGGFEPGVVDGRALLWDHEDERWVCAASGMHAETSPDLTLSYEAPIGGPDDPESLHLRLRRRLEEDFERNVVASAFGVMQNPPAEPAEGDDPADAPDAIDDSAPPAEP